MQNEIVRSLHPDIGWEKAYKSVEDIVRRYFELNPTLTMTTKDLVMALMPDPRGPEIQIQARLYKALAALQKHGLKDHVTKSTTQKWGYGNKFYPPIWHAPKSRVECSCPHCGGAIDGDNPLVKTQVAT